MNKKLNHHSLNNSIVNVSNRVRGAVYTSILNRVDLEATMHPDVYDPITLCVDISVWESISSRVFWDINKMRKT